MVVVDLVAKQSGPTQGAVGIVVGGRVGIVGPGVPAVAVGTGPVSHPTQAAKIGSS